MRWIAPLAGVAAIASALYACDGDATGSLNTGDAGTDSPTADADRCCPPDPKPDCCMDYGGARRDTTYGDGCGKSCDGMPVSGDPGWTIGTDRTGCPVWTNPHDYFHGGTESPTVEYCGGVRPEVDAGEDAADAADADAADGS